MSQLIGPLPRGPAAWAPSAGTAVKVGGIQSQRKLPLTGSRFPRSDGSVRVSHVEFVIPNVCGKAPSTGTRTQSDSAPL